jgi:hypothetical protein
MKRLGIVFLGVGFGIVCYIIFILFFHKTEIISPIEEIDTNKVIKQNNK